MSLGQIVSHLPSPPDSVQSDEIQYHGFQLQPSPNLPVRRVSKACFPEQSQARFPETPSNTSQKQALRRLDWIIGVDDRRETLTYDPGLSSPQDHRYFENSRSIATPVQSSPMTDPQHQNFQHTPVQVQYTSKPLPAMFEKSGNASDVQVCLARVIGSYSNSQLTEMTEPSDCKLQYYRHAGYVGSLDQALI